MMVASLSAAAAIYWAAVPWTFPLTVALGGLATYIWNWSKDMALHVGLKLAKHCKKCGI